MLPFLKEYNKVHRALVVPYRDGKGGVAWGWYCETLGDAQAGFRSPQEAVAAARVSYIFADVLQPDVVFFGYQVEALETDDMHEYPDETRWGWLYEPLNFGAEGFMDRQSAVADARSWGFIVNDD